MRKNYLLGLLALSVGAMNAYALDVKGGTVDPTDWMKNIPGTTYASQVSFPGSHDSATGYDMSFVGDWASQCQEVDIPTQLNSGVRAFDVRPGLYNNTWYCYHGLSRIHLTIDQCFKFFTDFLEAHPTEFIVIHLYPGGGHGFFGLDAGWDDSQRESFRKYIEGASFRRYLVDFRRNYTVDDLRGNILLFSRDDYRNNSEAVGGIFTPFRDGMNWDSSIGWERATQIKVEGSGNTHLNEGTAFYQDLASTSTGLFNVDGNRAAKTKGIQDLYNFTSGYNPVSGESCIWSFNFLSAYTGYTSSTDGYQNNAARTAPVMINCITTNPGPTGVVLSDYVLTSTTQPNGVDLIATIIKNNFEYLEWTEDGVGDPTAETPSDVTGEPTFWSEEFKASLSSTGVIGDFTNDGKLDVMATGDANLYSGKDWSKTALGIAKMEYPQMVALDYNNDGKLDVLLCGNGDENSFAENGIAYANYSSKSGDAVETATRGTVLYENGGNNSFTAVENTGLPIVVSTSPGKNIGKSSQPRPFAVGDFNHDGYVDVVVTGYIISNGSLAEHSALYLNKGNGTFEMSVDFRSKFGAPFGNAFAADFNNDGWLDVVFEGNTSDGNFFINDQNGGFVSEASKDGLKMYFSRSSGSMVGDFNKDGYLDYYMIGVSDYTGGANYIWYNSGGFGQNVFAAPYDLGGNGIDVKENFRIDLYDANYDGNLDIIYDDVKDNNVYYASELMTFVAEEDPLGNHGDNADFATAFGDLNGDGAVDRYQEGSFYINGIQDVPTYPQPTNVDASFINDQLTVTWDDIDDKTVGYNVVLHNEATGEVISVLPVSVNDDIQNPLMVADGKEAAIRPGVQKYVLNIPWSKFGKNSVNGMARAPYGRSNFRVGVQTVGVQYSEDASAIKWVSASDVTDVEEVLADVAKVNVTVSGDEVTVTSAEDCAVRVIDMLGRTVATGVANTPIHVAASGVFVVVTPTSTTKISK